MFEDRTISLLSYNTETLLAEKIDFDLLIEAFQATCKKRETIYPKEEIEDTLSKIRNDKHLFIMREQFRKKNFFVWRFTMVKMGRYIVGIITYNEQGD